MLYSVRTETDMSDMLFLTLPVYVLLDWRKLIWFLCCVMDLVYMRTFVQVATDARQHTSPTPRAALVLPGKFDNAGLSIEMIRAIDTWVRFLRLLLTTNCLL